MLIKTHITVTMSKHYYKAMQTNATKKALLRTTKESADDSVQFNSIQFLI